MVFLYRLLLVLSTILLVSCGGGGGGDDSGGAFTGPSSAQPSGAVTQVSITTGGDNQVLEADGERQISVSASVTNKDGESLQGVVVTFTTDVGTLSQKQATTDSQGIAKVMLTAPTIVGVANITASVPEGIIGTGKLQFVAGNATRILIVPPRIVNTGREATLKATIFDAHDNVVTDKQVTFFIIAQGSGNPSISPSVPVTDNNGIASTTYHAGDQAGTDEILIRLPSGQSEKIAIEVQPFIAAFSTSQSTEVADLGENVAAKVGVIAQDSLGKVVAGAEVTFATPKGALAYSTDSVTGGTSSLSVTTDSNGLAEIWLVIPSPEEKISVPVTATGAGVNGVVTRSVNVNFSSAKMARVAEMAKSAPLSDTKSAKVYAKDGKGTSVSIETAVKELNLSIGGATGSSAGVLPADGKSQTLLRIEAIDFDDEPAQGVEVTFSTTAGTLSATKAITDTQGIAQVTLTSPKIAGNASVSVSAGGAYLSGVISFVPGAPEKVLLQSASSEVEANNSTKITAMVKDAYGNRISGSQINFSIANAESGTPTITPVLATTNEDGLATVTYTGGAKAGTDTIRARLSGGEGATLDIKVQSFVVQLLASSPQLESGSTAPITLTAIVRNADGVLLPGVEVQFTADNDGNIAIIRSTTDEAGSAQAHLSTPQNKGTRFITATATAGNQSDSTKISVQGTTITLSGPSSTTFGGSANLIATVKDSAGQPVPNAILTATSSQGNKLSVEGVINQVEVITDSNGQASIAVFIIQSETRDVITVQGSGTQATFALNIEEDTKFEFTSLHAEEEVKLQDEHQIIIQWTKSGLPQTGLAVHFASSRGELSESTATVDSSGYAIVTIHSQSAGLATITANGINLDGSQGPSAQVMVEFIASNPNSMRLQADPLILGPGEQSTIMAVVRDADNNPVKHQRVEFNLTDVSGGRITPNFTTTDSLGQAIITYTASGASSGKDSILITAQLQEKPAITDQIRLTVGERPAFIRFGTGNKIEEVDVTRYAMPWSILVTDINGNPLANTRIQLSVLPTYYGKGRYVAGANSEGNFQMWIPSYVNGSRPSCANEDVNKNGIMDATEDLNNNGRLDPGNIATIPQTVTTDDQGFALVKMQYPKQYGSWTRVKLTATVTVAGTEYSHEQEFDLPVLFNDVQDENISPPGGGDSPFGSAGGCSSSAIPASIAFVEKDDSGHYQQINQKNLEAEKKSEISVRIQDIHGNPIEGELVSFDFKQNSSGGYFEFLSGFSSSYTDIDGIAKVIYHAGTLGGDDTLTATTSNGIDTGSNLIIHVSSTSEAASLELLPATNTLIADGKDKTKVEAIVTDQSGKPVAGVSVAFNSSAGSLSQSSVVTDNKGIAATFLTASTLVGEATVTAIAPDSGIRNSVVIQLIPGVPDRIALTVVDQLAPGEITPLIVAVQDAQGNPIVGEHVNIRIKSSIGSIIEGESSGYVTNSNGVITLAYQAGDRPGIDKIVVTTAGGRETTQSVTIQANQVSQIKLFPVTDTLIANGKDVTLLQVVATDQVDLPIQDVVIQFSTTAGTLSQYSVVTNENGIASVALTAPEQVGEATLTAIAVESGARDSAVMSFIAGSPAKITMATTKAQVQPGEASNIVVTVRDAQNNPVVGEHLSLDLKSKIGSLLKNETQDFITGNDGSFSVAYQAGDKQGTDKITAMTTAGQKAVKMIQVRPSATPTNLSLATSQVSVRSDNSDVATITASVLDADSVVVAGAEVIFQADGGQISHSSVLSDEEGNAKISFRAGAVDRSNHVVTITAKIKNSTLERQIPIQIIGTTLSLEASFTSLVTDDASKVARVNVAAKDAAGMPIYNAFVCFEDTSTTGGSLQLQDLKGVILTSDARCAIGEVFAGVTDVEGRVAVQATGVTPGSVSLKGYALGVTSELLFVVAGSDKSLQITQPKEDIVTIPLSSTQEKIAQQITVTAPGVREVLFATTLGKLQFGSGSSLSEGSVLRVPVENDVATVKIYSDIAGTANVLVRDVESVRSDNVTVVFSAPVDQAETLLIDASPRILPVSRASTYTSTIIARILTKNGQPVSNAVVGFTLQGATGGGEFLSSPMAITDSAGEARVTFTSGLQASSAQGIPIRATVLGTALERTFNIVITDKAGSVIIGRGTDIKTGTTDTAYALPMSVLVADVNGNPVPNAIVNLSAWPVSYSTGIRDTALSNGIDNGTAIFTDSFANEDSNENLILDQSEDLNGNDSITPPNSAAGTLPRQVTTDAQGLAVFDLVYLKQNAEWITDRIRASTSVGGTEIISTMEMRLPANDSDISGVSGSTGGSGSTSSLPSSPFNESCPFEVAEMRFGNEVAANNILYIPSRESRTVSIRLKKKTRLDLSGLSVAGRPVTRLIGQQVALTGDSSVYTNTADISEVNTSLTDAEGWITSTIQMPSFETDGRTNVINYYVSCAYAPVKVVVGTDPSKAQLPKVTLDVRPTLLSPGTEASILVTVRDQNGAPLSGQQVNLDIVENNSGSQVAAKNSARGFETNSAGQVEAIYTAGGNVEPQDPVTDILRAKVAGTTPTAESEEVAIKVDTSATLVGSIELGTGSSVATVGGVTPVNIRAFVKDINDKPAQGVKVVFTTNAGRFADNGVAIGEAIADPRVTSVFTDSNGIANATLLSGNLLGTATVKADANGYIAETGVNFVAQAPAQLQVLATPQDVRFGQESVIIAAVYDTYGNPVMGETVNFTLKAQAHSGSLSATNVVTDASGQAQVAYVGGDSEVEDVILIQTTSELKGQAVVKVSPIAVPAKISLAASQIAVKSDNSDQTTITASVLDNHNAGIPDIEVSFKATGGQLSVATARTDEKGNASVTFQAGSMDRRNQVAMVTASASGYSSQIPIQIVGTTLTLSANNTTLAIDDNNSSLTIDILAQDAGKIPVYQADVCLEGTSPTGGSLALTDQQGTALPESCPEDVGHGRWYAGKTDVNGRITIKAIGKSSGAVRLSAYGLGASTGLDLEITDTKNLFRILKPEIPADGSLPVVTLGQSHVLEIAAPDTGSVNLATSVGVLSGVNPVGVSVQGSAITVGVDHNLAQATLTSNVAGVASVMAQDGNNTKRSDTRQLAFSAPVENASKLILDASARVLPVSQGAVKYSTSLVARLLTQEDQPVANAVISFTMENPTGGGEYLSTPRVVTNTAGEARVEFTSGTQATSGYGLRIRATLIGQDGITNNIDIVITDKAGSVILGRADKISTTPDGTAYILPMTVLVADVNGNPVNNASVNLSAWPTSYRTGIRDRLIGDNIFNGSAVITDVFPNEDINRNIILDASDDFNGNGRLTPPNSAAGTLPREVKTDSNGLATFNLVYLKQNAQWINNEIKASTFVGGTEIVSQLEFTLPALIDDIYGASQTDYDTIGGTLTDSPFNGSCPFRLVVDGVEDQDAVFVQSGSQKSITLRLERLPGDNKVTAEDLVDRPVTALVENSRRLLTETDPTGVVREYYVIVASATEGRTNSQGEYASVLSASQDYSKDGESVAVYYYASCASKRINMVVGNAANTPPKPAQLGLATTHIAVKSDNSDEATVTASVLDANHAGVANTEVSFTATGGQLSLAKAQTDEKGNATVTFRAGSVDRSNQIATITATAGTETAQIPIQIIGTSLALSAGNTSIPIDSNTQVALTVSATDAGGNPIYYAEVCVTQTSQNGGEITLLDSSGVVLTESCTDGSTQGGILAGRTGVDGRLSLLVQWKSSGDVSVSASGVGAKATLTFTASPIKQVFKISQPAKDPLSISELGTSQIIVISAPGSQSVIVATSLGELNGVDEAGNSLSGTVITVPVVGSEAKVNLSSRIAGTASVLAQDSQNTLRTDTIKMAFSAPLAKAGKLLLDAAPRVLPVSRGGVEYTTTLIARVLTAEDQPVANALVTFTLENSTGGGETLSPPIAVTDTSGEARVTFVSGTQATSAKGLSIKVQVAGTQLSNSFDVIITDKAGSVVIGQSDSVGISGDKTAYILPMSVLVADINGNPVANTTVNLSAWPAYYSTGIRDTINSNNVFNGEAVITATFANEDTNENVILDAQEDTNGDGKLTPANSSAGTLPRDVKTDDNGIATFNLIYLKQNADWVVDRIRASTLVGGTEIISNLELRLPANDNDTYGPDGPTDIAPGGNLPDSPFNANCPYDLKVQDGDQLNSSTTLYVPIGGAQDILLQLGVQPDNKGNPPIGKQDIVALVDDGQRTLSAVDYYYNVAYATNGVTSTEGKFVSTISTSSVYARTGNSSTIYFYAGCAKAQVNVIVGEKSPDPAKIVASVSGGVQPNGIPPGGSVDLLVTVLDENDQPVSGQDVAFEVVDNQSGAQLSALSGRTNSNGQVKVVDTDTLQDVNISYTAGTTVAGTPKTDMIEMRLPGVPSAQIPITVSTEAILVGEITITLGSGDGPVILGGSDSVAVRAEVSDPDGNPAQGVEVKFASTLGTFITTETNSIESVTNRDGIAEVKLSPGSVAGRSTISANVNGFIASSSVDFLSSPSAQSETVAIDVYPAEVRPGETSTLTITVKDGHGNPIQGEVITTTLSTKGSGVPELDQFSFETNVNGEGTVVYIAGNRAGTDTITIRTSTGLTRTVDMLVSQGSSSEHLGGAELTFGSATLPADGVSTTTVRALVTSVDGNPMEGVSVAFATTIGTLEATTVLTDSDGIAETTLTASTIAGTATIRVTAKGGFSSEGTVIFAATQASKITMTSYPATVRPGESSLMTVTLQDSHGNPVTDAGITIGLGTVASGSPLLSETSVQTDSSGRAQVTYTAGSSLGSDVLIARTSTGLSATLTIPVSRTALVGTLNLTLGSGSVPADGESKTTLRATVLTASGSPVEGASVTFASTMGTLGVNPVVLTDSQGIAEMDLIAPTQAGTATIRVSVNGVSSEGEVAFVSTQPSQIKLVSYPENADTGGSTALTVTVQDEHDNPVVDTPVTFALTSTGSGNPALGSSSVRTDINGQASVSYTAGNRAGTDAVTARLVTGLSRTVNILVSRYAPITSLTLTSGSTTLPADGVSQIVLRATALSTNSAPVEGTIVSFATTAGSLSASSAITNAQGVAEVMLTAPEKAGVAAVQANSNGFSSDSLDITFRAGQASQILLDASPSSVSVGDEVTLTATLLDGKKNPVGNQTIRYELTQASAPDALLAILVGTTDDSGQVSTTYTLTQDVNSHITVLASAPTVGNLVASKEITFSASAVVSKVELLLSSPELDSDDATPITLTALVRDGNNNIIEGVPVVFSSDGGAIEVTQSTTNSSGKATATLSTAGDPTNRTVTVTATSKGVQSTKSVQVVGTTILFTGSATTATLNQTVTLSIELQDSSGAGIPLQPITLSSSAGNAISNLTPVTDIAGRATVTINVTKMAADQITATALGVTSIYSLAVNTDYFEIEKIVDSSGAEPSKDDSGTPLLTLGKEYTLTLSWKASGVAQSGRSVQFSTARGTFTSSSSSSATATTNSSGTASVTLSATNAGPAKITATGTTSSGASLSTQKSVEFVASTPASITVQADPTLVGVNTSGSDQEQSTIVAIVRDANYNLVKGVTVNFSLTDVTGGYLTTPSATTDSFGKATTVYVAGQTSTAYRGVTVTAEVASNTSLKKQTNLTVSQKSLFITLGTGNVIEELDDTRYSYPYSVMVTDAAGGPVQNALVSLSILPTQYYKGYYYWDSTTSKWLVLHTASSACSNEDLDFNGILDSNDSDLNSDGIIEPGNIVTIETDSSYTFSSSPPIVQTDESGFALFSLVYPQDHAQWVDVTLTARALVSGGEFTQSASFTLPILSTDAASATVSPPGFYSPYGTATSCDDPD